MKRLILMVVAGCTLTACAKFSTVMVDGIYDVPIEIGEVRGETTYFVNAIYMKTKNRPAPSIQQDVYVKAIEKLSGCDVIPTSIRWKENEYTVSPIVMTANVACK